MFVRNHMTEVDFTTGPGTPVREVLDSAVNRGTPYVPIVDAHDGLLGMFTPGGFCAAVHRHGCAALDVPVFEVMIVDPMTISADAPLEEALEYFCANGETEVLPVTTGRRLEGLLRREDLLRSMARMLGLDQPGSSVQAALVDPQTDVPNVFAAICRSKADVVSAFLGYARDDGDEPVLHVRVANADRRRTERMVAELGLILLAPPGSPQLRAAL